MIKNNIVRKPVRSKIILKCLLLATVVAVVVCLLLTMLLNTLLVGSIAVNEDMLLDSINSTLSSCSSTEFESDSMHIYSDLVLELNMTPRTIGRETAVYVDGKPYAYTNGNPFGMTDLADVSVIDVSQGYEIRISDSHHTSEEPDVLYMDYASQRVIENIFPFFDSYFYVEESPVALEYPIVSDIQIEGDLEEVGNMVLIIPESLYEYEELDESKFTETLGEVRVFYDAAGGVHTYSVKVTPNLYAKSIFQNTKNAMFILYGLILLICLIVGTINSVVVYYRRKNIYDTFAYRTDITNALAHDLKTPLAAISSYAENYEVSSDKSKKDYYVSKISENARYMDSLISKTLELSKAENTMVVGNETISVGSIVEETLEQLDNVIKEKKLTVSKANLSDKSIKTDKVCFKSSLVALLENSIKYAPAESEIVISSDDTNLLKITNKYTGEIEDTANLKKAFVRGNKARGDMEGSGLGLSIADKNLSKLGFTLLIDASNQTFTAIIKK